MRPLLALTATLLTACSGTASPDAGGLCTPDQTLCGSECVSLHFDAAHCGACNNPCPTNQVCSHLSCYPICNAGADMCSNDAGRFCAVLKTDNDNCGDCGIRCAAGTTCLDGGCA